jgi:hypothetical protein
VASGAVLSARRGDRFKLDGETFVVLDARREGSQVRLKLRRTFWSWLALKWLRLRFHASAWIARRFGL